MKARHLVFLLVAMTAIANTALAQGSAFTYQGRLTDGANSANGQYDLRFILYTAPVGGSQAGLTLTNENVPVSNGLFTTSIDFGPGVFNGTAYWLEIGVRPGVNSGAFTLLNPRQALTPAPLAIFSQTADTLDGLDSLAFAPAAHTHQFSQIGGSVADHQLSANVALLSSGATFNGPVTANGDLQGTRLNVGAGHRLTEGRASILGGLNNTNNGLDSTIGGGFLNWIQPFADDVVIAGGRENTIGRQAYYATIGGGVENVVETISTSAVISGGELNAIRSGATHAVIGGGIWNEVGTNSPRSFIGGGEFNVIGTNSRFSTISGGLQNRVLDNSSDATISGGFGNHVLSNSPFATIGGGVRSTNSGWAATISGGEHNHARARWATVGGGVNHQATSDASTVAGGNNNRAMSFDATVGGGSDNTASGFASTVPGGHQNRAQAAYTLAAGRRANAVHEGAYVWADSTDTDFPSSAVNEFAVRARGGVRIDSAGAGMSLDGQPVLSGVVESSKLADGAVTSAKIAGGAVTGAHIANGSISAGDVNASSFATAFWKADGNAGTTPGTHFLGTTDNQPLEFKVNGQRALRLEPKPFGAVNLIGGFAGNFVSSLVNGSTIGGGGMAGGSNAVFGRFATIGGGRSNAIHTAADFTTVGGGHQNLVQQGALHAVIGGGLQNVIGIDSVHAAIGGGYWNTNSATSATIAGGVVNRIETNSVSGAISGGSSNIVQFDSQHAVIGGGLQNTIEWGSSYATIGGGVRNVAEAPWATVPGGADNFAGGQYSFAAGHRAKTDHHGVFVWADSRDEDFASTADNQFCLRASGGVRLFSRAPNCSLQLSAQGSFISWPLIINQSEGSIMTITNGGQPRITMFANGNVGIGNTNPTARLQVGDATCNGTTWINASDRNLKTNFQAVNSLAVLEKVATLPLARWTYREQQNEGHLGPVAQDFHAAFGLGGDDRHIATVDADGVALAAIQGLNQKVEEQLREKDARLRLLEQELAALKEFVTKLSTSR
jgi:hypothetical protein